MENNLLAQKILELKKYKKNNDLSEHVSNSEKKLLKKEMPIQKIVGFTSFSDVKINLNHKVFIPRYETEEVMLKSLSFLNKYSSVLDLCTGSGYIGLALKKANIELDVTLSDIDLEAIKQARENAIQNKLDVQIIKSNLFGKISRKFDLIVSNPPYISKDYKLDNSIKKFEPRRALFAKNNGLHFYQKIIESAPKYLNPNGYLVFEISQYAADFFIKKNFEVENDINKNPRIAYKQFNIRK